MSTEQADQQRTCCCLGTTGGRWLTWLLIAVLAAVAVCVFAYQSTIGKRKSSTPYRLALEAVQRDPAVIQALGEPVRDVTWFPQGMIEQRELGEARWDFDVAGPKNKAHVRVTARYISGKWSLQQLEVTPSGGQTIRIDVRAADDHPDDAPPWTPPVKEPPAPSGGTGRAGKTGGQPAAEKPASEPQQVNPPQINLPMPGDPSVVPPQIDLAPPPPPQ